MGSSQESSQESSLGAIEGDVMIDLGECLKDEVWNQVHTQVWGQVRAQVGGQVWGQVCDQVWGQVCDQVWGQIEEELS